MKFRSFGSQGAGGGSGGGWEAGLRGEPASGWRGVVRWGGDEAARAATTELPRMYGRRARRGRNNHLSLRANLTVFTLRWKPRSIPRGRRFCRIWPAVGRARSLFRGPLMRQCVFLRVRLSVCVCVRVLVGLCVSEPKPVSSSPDCVLPGSLRAAVQHVYSTSRLRRDVQLTPHFSRRHRAVAQSNHLPVPR